MKITTSTIIMGIAVVIAIVLIITWSRTTGAIADFIGASAGRYQLTPKEHRLFYFSQIEFPEYREDTTKQEIDYLGERIKSLVRPRMPKDLRRSSSKAFADHYWGRIWAFFKGADLAPVGVVLDDKDVADSVVRYLTSGQAREADLVGVGEFKDGNILAEIKAEANCPAGFLYDANLLICYPEELRQKPVPGNEKLFTGGYPDKYIPNSEGYRELYRKRVQEGKIAGNEYWAEKFGII